MTASQNKASPSASRDSAGDASAERVLEGISLSPGIAIGQAHLYASASDDVDKQRIREDDVEREITLFEEALERSDQELGRVIALSREKLGEDSTAIFEAQRMMLNDDELLTPVRRRIRDDRQNAGYAVKTVMEQHRHRLEASDDKYLRERASDLSDIQDRIIRQLRRGKMSADIGENTIVIAEALGAADVIRFNKRGVLGCVSEHGGTTSHVALITRALGLPSAAGIRTPTARVPEGACVIVDGDQGQLIVHPTDDTIAAYRQKQAEDREASAAHKEIAGLPAETKDGHRIQLMANIEFHQELDLVDQYGAAGIGLLRTEMLFLMRRSVSLSEEMQYEMYRTIVETVPGVSTIRLLDLGGDKMLPLAHREHNPFLGWRGIRVLLDRPELLRPQVRALLRTSAHGPIRILLPMVTDQDEVMQFYELMHEVRSELSSNGHAVGELPPVGVMVEVPAVALRPNTFAPHVDFFSIGTNDLTQYVLAVDRGNDRVASRYDAFHPAVLSLVQRTVTCAHDFNIPVSLCGEIGSEPRALPILLGLGLDAISAPPTYLPPLKRAARSIRFTDARALAQEALQVADAAEVHDLNAEWIRIHAPEILDTPPRNSQSSGVPEAADS
jgi:phosphotransferase system enzyme I (PtsI)